MREPGYLEGEFKKLPIPIFTLDDMPRGTERKNRYSNVLPTPKTRVHLSLLPGQRPNSDYINANYIRGYQGTPSQYIATQGPMESTVEDFWRMVWDNNTDIIVMATNFTERGIDKCCRYWPAQGSEGYGDLEVTLLHQTMTDTYSESTLSLRSALGGDVRTVRHYRLTCWPSQGVPKETKTVTGFLREVKMADSRGPVVVHCSAGVGRTGVLLAIDIGLQGILQGHSKLDVLRVVSTLRQDRTGCVQTRDQYRFIHQAVYDVAKELGPQKGLRPLK
jgi:protein tyrosine phosphatase